VLHSYKSSSSIATHRQGKQRNPCRPNYAECARGSSLSPDAALGMRISRLVVPVTGATGEPAEQP